MRKTGFLHSSAAIRAVAIAGMGAMAFAVVGCSSGGTTGASGTSGPSLAERFSASSSTVAQAGDTSGSGGNSFDPANCPPIDIRTGTSTLTINAASREPEGGGLRYQGTIGQTARECSSASGNLTIKVGVQGRLILGPAGTSGNVDIPLRFALVQEGIQPKTIWTKLYQVPVIVGDGQASVTFTHVEEDMTVPRPSAAMLDSYVIYVGFDPLGATRQPRRPAPKPARQPARG